MAYPWVPDEHQRLRPGCSWVAVRMLGCARRQFPSAIGAAPAVLRTMRTVNDIRAMLRRPGAVALLDAAPAPTEE